MILLGNQFKTQKDATINWPNCRRKQTYSLTIIATARGSDAYHWRTRAGTVTKVR